MAKLAVGLAGFTGVAATFGGRTREYSEADKIRVEGIFLASASVLAISLCVLTLGRTEIRIEAVYAFGDYPGPSFWCASSIRSHRKRTNWRETPESRRE